jgi:hypothetical protein
VKAHVINDHAMLILGAYSQRIRRVVAVDANGVGRRSRRN